MERRFSRRLEKKRKISNSLEGEQIAKLKLQTVKRVINISETCQSSNQTNRIKDSRSKSFLDCLELQPVDPDASNESLGKTSTKTKNRKHKSEMKKDVPASQRQSTNIFMSSKLSMTKKCSKKVQRCLKLCPTTVEVHMNKNDNDTHTPSHVSTADTNPETLLLDSGNCSDPNVTHTDPPNQHVLMNDAFKENVAVSDGQINCDDTEKHGETNSQIYIFRDVNKVAHGSCQDEPSSDLFATVDLNKHGKKRRYDKLIKKLVDSEKNLEINLKEVQYDDIDKTDITQCVEKMKEKLRVREKKKYEYLINYMRDQWRVDQKSFQDILPQKVDLVKENVVRQLAATNDRKVVEKRKRGRPKKVNIAEDKLVHSPGQENSQVKPLKPNNCQKKKDSAIIKGFPVKFPKSLLSDNSFSQNRSRVDKFRVGIIDKNGGQEFIELNSETLQGMPSNTTDNISDTSSKQEGNTVIPNRQKSDADASNTCPSKGQVNSTTESQASSSDINVDGTLSFRPYINTFGDEFTIEGVDKCPPRTINLPPISSLETDYELVSLSPACPSLPGDFHTDDFFIPQSTFDQDGKTGMIMVGPFCLVCDPKPRLLLVSPEERKKGPTMILRKKIHSPSNTPPRDFRIHKESRWVRIPYKPPAENIVGQRGDPAVILLDHNYMTPPELRDNIRRYCKAVAKHSANVQFIDARVENITTGEDNYVVTIKGDNMLHQVKNGASSTRSCNKDGIPVAYNLNQIMTSALIKAEQSVQREKLALQSRQTGDYTPVMYPFSAMGDVVMEVLIPPGGTELTRTRSRHLQCLEESVETNTSGSEPSKLTSTVHDSREINFLHRDEMSSIESSPSQEHAQAASDTYKTEVVVENASAVDSGPLPGLPCCRVCLRLFPSDYMLFTHVRSNHPASETTDIVYLEELRARSHLTCPICCNPPALLATPAKLKRHLRANHGIEHYVEICRVCQAEFLDKHELELHMELSHNSFAGRRLVSLLKPHQMGHLLRGHTPLISDYLSCSRCNIMFSDRVSLLTHTLKVHPELNRLNMCGLCDRFFDTTVSLHKHLKKSHEQTHDGALKCPFCPAWLSNMELASIHRVTLHTGAVPVHCPFCGAGFQNLHLMYNHVRTHHLLTQVHVCSECQASFPSSRLLSEHMRKAHIMRPRIIKDNSHSACNMTYCCPFCAMTFMRTYDLAIHVINAHRECLLPSQCQLCMQSFVSDVVMQTHMSGAHGIDTATDSSYVHGHYEDGQSVSVVLQDDRDDVYTHTKDMDASAHGRALLRGQLLNTQDILDSHEADQFIDLDDQDTIVYLTDGNHIVSSGEIFGECSTMEDVQLLGEASDDFHFHGVDYLETLTNDSIAVGADVVAELSMDDIANNGGVDGAQGNRNQDMLAMTRQFEIDGVLYELAATDDSSGIADVDTTDLRLSRVDVSDLAHLLRHTNLS